VLAVVLPALACGDDENDASTGDSASTTTMSGETTAEAGDAASDSGASGTTGELETGADTNSTTEGAPTPEDACISMCMTDIECDPMHEPWTLDECTMICLSDLDADGGPCKAEYTALWACVGALSCEEYLDWVYGDPPHPCGEQVDAVDACEGGGKSGGSRG